MTAKTAPASLDDQQQKIGPIPVERLLLDRENPRLASGTGAKTQKELLEVLWNEMAVDEVALSIAANGYFREEPLFVIPEKPSESDETKRRYIVVEGNRRLAAVRILRDESLRKELGADNLPILSASERAQLDRLPASIYESRKDLWEFFGFRHINGPKPWDAYSKAKYVADIHDQYRVPLNEIARKIGDRHATVRRLYRGFKILQQAETMVQFSRDDIVRNRFSFSHLYTAADQPEFQKFLGITSEGSLKPNPVPKSKLKELGEFMLWLYGSKTADKQPLVRSQNPDLNILREVISDRKGLSALRAGLSLERAKEISAGDERRFREALTRAKEDLQQAKATVTTGYSGEPDLHDTISDIVQVAESIKAEMELIRKRLPREARHH